MRRCKNLHRSGNFKILTSLMYQGYLCMLHRGAYMYSGHRVLLAKITVQAGWERAMFVKLKDV